MTETGIHAGLALHLDNENGLRAIFHYRTPDNNVGYAGTHVEVEFLEDNQAIEGELLQIPVARFLDGIDRLDALVGCESLTYVHVEVEAVCPNGEDNGYLNVWHTRDEDYCTIGTHNGEIVSFASDMRPYGKLFAFARDLRKLWMMVGGEL